MAEVYTPKRTTSVWPWVLAALVVGLVLWFLSARDDRRAEPRASLSSQEWVASVPAGNTA